MFDKNESFTLSTGKNAPDPRELLKKHNEMKEESRKNHNKEKIIDALSQIPEKYLVPVEEIGSALKIMYNRIEEFLDSGRELSEKDGERMFNNLYKDKKL